MVLSEAQVTRIVGEFETVPGLCATTISLPMHGSTSSRSWDWPADSVVSLYPVYDARQLTSVGPNYVGNLLCYPSLYLSVQEIAAMELDALSSLIREGTFDLVVKGDDVLEEIQEVAHFTQQAAKGRYLLMPLYDSMFGSGLLFNNLMSMPCKQFDFGSGGPSHIDMPLSDPIRFVQIYPSAALAGLCGHEGQLASGRVGAVRRGL